MARRTLSTSIVLVSLLAAGWWLTRSPAEAAHAAAAPRVQRVVVAPATLSEAPLERRAYGSVRAADRAMLGFTVGGRLLTRPVQVGDHVKKGQLLARLDARGYANAARAAEARLAQAGAQLGQRQRDQARLRKLRDQAAISAEQAEQISTALEGADAERQAADVQLDEARRTLRETRLRAPFAGVVVAVQREPGELVASGQPVVVLSGKADFEVEVELPTRIATQLVAGDRARVHFPLTDLNVADAVVGWVGQSAAGPGRLFPVLVSWPVSATPDLRPGTAAEVRLALKVKPALTVPASAIVAPVGVDPVVFRVQQGRVQRVPVQLGEVRGEHVAVQGALEPGDPVVIAGYAGLLDGEPVEVTP